MRTKQVNNITVSIDKRGSIFAHTQFKKLLLGKESFE
jgi:hypothetical protein